MRRTLAFLALLAANLFSASAQGPVQSPPMGWNSWDAYGLTINEQQFRDNATVLSSLKRFGWNYAVIDEGWYMADPFANSLPAKKYLWDKNGILVPDPARFPSAANGAGFKPLADWLHAQGLKFGIHLVRGIPRQVVDANLPIAGSPSHAADAADKSSPCPWDEGNWGIADNAAGQAYYDSMIRLYAGWGVDFLKVDCISDHPYRVSEIRQIANSIRKSGRTIVLSLSPGPTQLEHAVEIQKYAQMWRITNDHWDQWAFERHTDDGFPFGLAGEFDMMAKWAVYSGPGSWPDADMLPEGSLTPHPGWGDPRQSRFTPDEQRTEFTLFAISRSPLILGGNLTKLDDFSRKLYSNRTVTFLNQNASLARQLDPATLGPEFAETRVWRTTIESPGARGYAEYFGFFNLANHPVTLHAQWKQLGLDAGKHTATDVWTDTDLKESKEISVTLAPHASALYEVR